MITESAHRVRPVARERGIAIPIGAIWHRVALAAILVLAGVLDFAGLSREGYANSYYAAAVKSMLVNWHNFWFNSFDPGGFVTIDKPPLGFWFQVLSAKIFGFSGVSILLPQALAGVLSVAVLYRLVSRTWGRAAGLIAALALSVTPISVVTNRSNTIDSTLVLAVLLGAWCVLRAAETGKLRWLLLSAVCVGLGFNIKMLEAFLVLPAYVLVYLFGAHVILRRRILSLLAAGAVLLAISLSWVTAVDLTPASQRPWVDSTSTNSELDLAIGYNGIERLLGQTGGNGPGAAGANRPVSVTTSTKAGTKPPTGTSSARSSSVIGSTSGSSSAAGSSSSAAGSGGGGQGGPGSGAGYGPGGIGENGPTGVFRLLDTQLGTQIGWLLPLAVIGLLVAAIATRPRLRLLDDRQRSLVLWGAWLLTMGVFFSRALFFHTYYLVMVAPSIAALAGIGIAALWAAYRRPGRWTWWLLPASLLVAAGVEAHILTDYPQYRSWLIPLTVGASVLAALVLIAARLLPRRPHLPVVVLSAAVAVLALLAGPATWSAYTVNAAQTGGILHAGPSTPGGTGAFGGPGGSQGGFTRNGSASGGFPGDPPSGSASGSRTGTPPSGEGFANGAPPLGSGAQGFGGPPAGAPPSGTFPGGPPGGNGSSTGGSGGAFGPPPGFSGRPGGGQQGGVLGAGGPGGSQVNSSLLKYLVKHRGTAKYLVATSSAGDAEGFILATGDPVMAMGGFTGSDPILNATKVAALVHQGVVRYFLLGGMGGPGGGTNSVSSWVQSNCTLVPSSKYSSSVTSSTAGFGGAGSLYDCGSTK